MAQIENQRKTEIRRETAETRIHLTLNIDGVGMNQVSTGIGFFDHMLAQLSYHGLLDLTLSAEGDLHIDPHHTVEDTALVIGQSFQQALGDRKGIRRMGSAIVPMDEALAMVALDFSGRGVAVFQGDWHGPTVGGLPTSLIEHFLDSFARSAGCNLHVHLLAGRDDHHQAEAIFKALGRAIEQATRPEPRRMGQVPSTKGSLDTRVQP